MQWIGYIFLRLVVELFRLVPFRLLYVVSDVFAFVLYKMIGYRKKVIWNNLRLAFPNLPDSALAPIVDATYLNLTDIALETIKEFTTPLPEIRRRMVCRNPELVNQHLRAGKSVILSGSHLNNWEWLGLSMPSDFTGPTIGSYKPMTNKIIDAFVSKRRSKGGLILTSMDDTFATMRKNRTHPSVYLLISDQSPSSRKSAHWLPFFGIETAFTPGMGFLARRMDLPVVHSHINRLRRGFYEIVFSEICTNPADMEPENITALYANLLEKQIRQQPSAWLWSHKRWKFQKDTAKFEQLKH